MNKFIRRIKSKLERGNEGSDKGGACSQQEQEPSGLHITDLPPEALALIFERCSYDVLARRVRLVCRRFCEVATLLLNCGFLTLGPKIDRAMLDAVSRFEEGRTLGELLVKTHPFTLAMVGDLPRVGKGRPTEQQLLMDQHCIALMNMKYKYRAVRAVTWRHIHSPYSGSGHRACFYAGSLLDEFLSFLRLARHSPTLLGFFMLSPTRENEIIKLLIRSSKFMNHFKIRTYNFGRNYSISDAKINDLCHGMTRTPVRTTPQEEAVTVNGTECHIEAHYRMPYTWLNCLPSSHAQPNQRSEEGDLHSSGGTDREPCFPEGCQQPPLRDAASTTKPGAGLQSSVSARRQKPEGAEYRPSPPQSLQDTAHFTIFILPGRVRGPL
ncbi:uncharacterized protein LOC110832631 isoform X2 [Zootermopsis nevadensis]|uniref:uncharacterized protein LOC110832631 isoform X2 n=1 Tax=Zootermopsis nevadensis TaxID=136037 RepID=UPI000B8EAA3B|nr:uncharacterized protein LOC110832631 isoform X2 [Zootermopsis nevadensis]